MQTISKKKISPLKGAKKEKCLLSNNLIHLVPIQYYMQHINVQKFCQNHWRLIYTLLIVSLGT
jgi:hypothetical protein